MSILNGKKVIIIGDRDGIPGEAIKACVETVKDAEVLFAATECFVWTAAGAMDLENQKRIKEFVEKFGGENIVVLFGAAEAEATGLAAETVMIGDPTYAGALSGVALGLAAYHAVEPEFKEAVDAGVYDEQVGMAEMTLNVDEIIAEIKKMRDENCKYK